MATVSCRLKDYKYAVYTRTNAKCHQNNFPIKIIMLPICIEVDIYVNWNYNYPRNKIPTIQLTRIKLELRL